MKTNPKHKPVRFGLSVKFALAQMTSMLLILSFPNFEQDWLAWAALVPLVLSLKDQRPRIAFTLGFSSGATTIFGICFWMFEVPAFRIYHALPLAFYLALYPALWSLMLSWLKRKMKPLIILGPALWAALDYVKAHAGFMAVSWATLAQSQHDNIAVLQLAAFSGEYGITFLVVMANIAIAEAFLRKRWRNLMAVAILIVLAHSLGFMMMLPGSKSETFKVAVVQPSILREEIETPQGRSEALDRLERLTISIAYFKPSLVVWPETAVRDLEKNFALYDRLKKLTQTMGAPILTGASENMKFSSSKDNRNPAVTIRQVQYNSAYFISPETSDLPQPYRKNILVPFGEYLPMESFFNWPSWLVPKVCNVLPGKGYAQFQLHDGRRISPVICWESLFGDYVRRIVKEDADLLVHLTNDNWFGKTAAPRQHNATSALRAVENRTPVVIASNTGPSQVIDAFGRIVAELPDLFTSGTVLAEIAAGYPTSFYTRYGDAFVFLCFAVLSVFGLSKCLFAKNPVRSRADSFSGTPILK